MNPQYLCRIFKQITSLSPIDYVNYLRIEQACTLLTTTTMPIIEIALDCGFNDCSYFARVFQKRKGVAPSEYRKQR